MNFHTVKSRPFFNNEGAHFEYRITFANWILLYVILFSLGLRIIQKKAIQIHTFLASKPKAYKYRPKNSRASSSKQLSTLFCCILTHVIQVPKRKQSKIIFVLINNSNFGTYILEISRVL